MKKFIVFLMLIPSFLFPQDYFSQEGEIVFKVKSNHYYEFKVHLKGNASQYFFKLKGESVFNFQIIEQSGNEWSVHVSDNNEIMVWENIMDKGVYTIRVYSIADNRIKMVWGLY
jgi:hypothetical protein